MPNGFLAYIMPVDGGAHPEHPIAPGGPPPGIWPSPGQPSHPIVLPPNSVGGTPEHPIYYPPGQPEHPIYLPPGSVGGTPEHPIYYPPTVWPPGGHPAHPIAPGGPPPGIWPSPGRPDNSLPLPPTMVPPELPPEMESMAVALTKLPGQDWKLRTMTVAPDQGLPKPQPV